MNPEIGVVTVPSRHSVDETVERLLNVLNGRGVKVFAVIDHSGEAAAAGLSMHPTKLVIFGNPKAGTPLMVAAPTAALDLPLKLLVAEDANAAVSITYNAPEYIRARHAAPPEFLQTLAVVAALAASVAN